MSATEPERERPTGSLWSGRPEVSKRTRTPLRRAAYALLAPILRVGLNLLCRSQRLVVVRGREHLDSLAHSGRPFLPCFWHESLIPSLLWSVRHRPPGLRPALLISPSVDGDLAVRVVEPWGFHVTRGSATRTGGPAIRKLYRAIRAEDLSLLILADGPHGPPHAAKPGAVMLSQLAGLPILPMAFHARPAVRLRSWDRLVVPLPFARVALACGPPIRIARDLAADRIQSETERLERVLEELGEGARGPRT